MFALKTRGDSTSNYKLELAKAFLIKVLVLFQQDTDGFVQRLPRGCKLMVVETFV